MLHLIAAYQRTKDIKTRNLIAKHYLYVATQVAGKVAVTSNVDKEDLEQEAAVELIEAIEDYDESKGTKFSTFAYSRIVGRLQQFMRDKTNIIKIPQNLYALNGKINKTRSKLCSLLKREPSDQEIIIEACVNAEDYYNAQSAMLAFNTNIVPIDDIDISDSRTYSEEEIEGNNTQARLDAPGNRRRSWELTIKNDSTKKQ